MTPKEMPDDATGDALRRIAENGSDLSREMEIDFFVAVPSEEMGKEIARRVAPLGFCVSVELNRVDSEWTCYCTKSLVPHYSTVVSIEERLDAIAREFGGYADGFGTFGNELKQ